MAVVDPDADWHERGCAPDDKIQIAITIDIAGDETQSAFFASDADRTRGHMSGKMNFNSVMVALVALYARADDREIRVVVSIQIGRDAALVRQARCCR